MRPEIREVEELAKLPEDELYRIVGEHLAGKQAMPLPSRKLIAMAKRWCSETLAPNLCTSEQIRFLARQDVPTQEIILAVSGVVDILGHLLGAIPAATVVALIVRVGLHKFCAKTWEPPIGPLPEITA